MDLETIQLKFALGAEHFEILLSTHLARILNLLTDSQQQSKVSWFPLVMQSMRYSALFIKVLAFLSHLLARIKSSQETKLPCQNLLELAQINSAFIVQNFALVFLQLGLQRESKTVIIQFKFIIYLSMKINQ